MFGISFSEILLILVISLLIFGPEKLPSIATKIGSFFASIRNLGLNLKHHIYEQSGFNQFENIRQEMRQTIADLKQHIAPADETETNTFVTESEFLYQEYNFLYQPELDFERQPELFDE